MADLPELYFRLRDRGATVFRVAVSDRDGRIDLEPLATVNLRTGAVRVHGGRTPTAREAAAIGDWIGARRAAEAAGRADPVQDTIDRMNLTAHWAQTKASDAEIEAATDRLLLAMHDLRTVLVRRRAERLAGP